MRFSQILPSEKFGMVQGAVPFVAACPGCGEDVKWRHVLMSVLGSPLGGRTIVEHEVHCRRCGS